MTDGNVFKKKPQPCHCKAYKFPHRLGSGKCTNKDLDGPFCTECGCSCSTHTVNLGIGHYEYWGQKCVDNDFQEVSTCCDAPTESFQQHI